jgi:hypothetical protein
LRVGPEPGLGLFNAGREVLVVGSGLQCALGDEGFQRLVLDLGGVQLLGVDGGVLAADAVRLFALGDFPFALGDLAAIDAGHAGVGATHHAGVALHADEGKGRQDQQQQDELEQARMSADKFKHLGSLEGLARP